MNSVFDYVQQDKIYTTDELNKLVDEINEREHKMLKNRVRALIREQDEVQQSIYSIYEKKLACKYTDGTVRSFITDFHNHILTMSNMELEQCNLLELVNTFKELKLLVNRLRDPNRFILQHVSPQEVLNHNLKLLINNNQDSNTAPDELTQYIRKFTDEHK